MYPSFKLQYNILPLSNLYALESIHSPNQTVTVEIGLIRLTKDGLAPRHFVLLKQPTAVIHTIVELVTFIRELLSN